MTPSRLPAPERREHFLAVAADLITEHGIDAVTMEGVAAAAGVSKGLGYAYFSNAEDLLMAVLRRELEDLRRRIIAAVLSETTFEARIRAAVNAWLDAVVERGGLLGTLLQASQMQQALAPHRRRVYAQIEDSWARMAHAEFGVPLDIALAGAAILIAGLAGLLERFREGESRQTLVDTFVGLTVGGLKEVRRLKQPYGGVDSE